MDARGKFFFAGIFSDRRIGCFIADPRLAGCKISH
jgi:hypothetical protein